MVCSGIVYENGSVGKSLAFGAIFSTGISLETAAIAAAIPPRVKQMKIQFVTSVGTGGD